MTNWEEKIEDSKIRLTIKTTLLSLKHKKEEMDLLDTQISQIRNDNIDKRNELNALESELKDNQHILKERTSEKVYGDKAYESLTTMIKVDRMNIKVSEREELGEMKKKTEEMNKNYLIKYNQLQQLLQTYNTKNTQRRITVAKANVSI